MQIICIKPLFGPQCTVVCIDDYYWCKMKGGGGNSEGPIWDRDNKNSDWRWNILKIYCEFILKL